MIACTTCAGTGIYGGASCWKCGGRKLIYEEAAGLTLSWDGITITGVNTFKQSTGRVSFANVTPLAATIVNGCAVQQMWPVAIEPSTLTFSCFGACPLTNAQRGKRAALSFSIGGRSASYTAALVSFDPVDAKANDVMRWSATFQLEG